MSGAWPTEVRWFEAIGTCRCGKPAHGKLMGSRNESYGAVCTPCARTALAAADKARAKATGAGQ